MLLENQTAVITGAADGLGLAMAKRFAAEGSTVVMGDIATEKNVSEAGAIRRDGGNAIAVTCDIGETAQVKAMISKAVEETGRLDILVNNAAIAIPGHPAEMPEKDWDRIMNVNLKGAFRCIQAALGHMMKQGSGVILNMASTQGHRSWYNFTAYAAAKGALLAMTRQLAGQLAPHGIRVNSISPGACSTPMNVERVGREGEEIMERWTQMHALGRIAEPEEVAEAALYLVGPGASFVTGHDLLVDGGLTVLPRYHELVEEKPREKER